MGLLSKAAVQFNPQLDEMGQVLRDRILRLPRKSTAPDTALSLLKAYVSFHSALCFALSGGSYTSYASSGSGEEKISVPTEKLFNQSRGDDFFSLKGEELFSGAPAKGLEGELWCFPLDRGTPWHHVFLLSAEKSASFSPENTRIILSEIQAVLIPPSGAAPAKAKETSSSAEENDTGAIIDAYQKDNPTFQCIVMGGAKKNGALSAGINKLAAGMVSYFGSVHPLPRGACLILIPGDMDGEMVAHRLEKSMKTKAACSFAAESSAQALKLLKPYL
jgi:hypothetical protein